MPEVTLVPGNVVAVGKSIGGVTSGRTLTWLYGSRRSPYVRVRCPTTRNIRW